MAPNLKLGLELDLGPLHVAVLSTDRLVLRALTGVMTVRNDIILTQDVAQAHVALWDVLADGALEGLDLPVLALVASPEEARAARARGVTGAIDRGADGASIIAALIAVRYGLCVFDLAYAPERLEMAVDEGEPLTERELEVLELLAAGLPNREIAPLLGVTLHTIKFHLSSVFSKLGVGSRTEAVVEGVKRGLVTL